MCPQCPSLFFGKKKLKAHLLTHTDEKRFSCELCPKKFKRKTHCTAHYKLFHSHVRSFLCCKCPKLFKLRHHLNEHEITHGEKSFSCSDCTKSFFTKKSLKSHMKTHMEKDLFCEFCILKFKHKCNLKSHIKTHTEKKKWKCGECQKLFLTIHYLKSHLSRTHKNTSFFQSKSPKSINGYSMYFNRTLVGEKKLMKAAYVDTQGNCLSYYKDAQGNCFSCLDGHQLLWFYCQIDMISLKHSFCFEKSV